MKTLEPLPYFKWLWRDWRANRKVQRLDYIAKGLYRELLDEQWSEGSIPAGVDELADICNCPVDVMQQHWPVLSNFFEESENGRLINRKLEDQRTEEDKVRAQKARGGKRSRLAKTSLTPPEEVLTSPEDLPYSRAEQSKEEQSRAVQDDSEIPLTGQEDEMKAEKQIDVICEQFFGKRAYLRGRNGEDLKRLITIHKGSAVERAFGDWARANQDDVDIKDPVARFLEEADEMLSGESPARAATKKPEIVRLIVKLSRACPHLSFGDRETARIAEVSSLYTEDEIVGALKLWAETQDFSVPKTVQWAAKNFSEAALVKAEVFRQEREEATAYAAKKEAAVQRMQASAQADLEAAKAEEESPLELPQ